MQIGERIRFLSRALQLSRSISIHDSQNVVVSLGTLDDTMEVRIAIKHINTIPSPSPDTFFF